MKTLFVAFIILLGLVVTLTVLVTMWLLSPVGHR
jgi:hypothetical protein